MVLNCRIFVQSFTGLLTLPRIWFPTEMMFPFFFHINTNPWSLKLKILWLDPVKSLHAWLQMFVLHWKFVQSLFVIATVWILSSEILYCLPMWCRFQQNTIKTSWGIDIYILFIYASRGLWNTWQLGVVKIAYNNIILHYK